MKKIFLLLTAVLTAGMLSAETIYGDCGTNMEWEFNTGSGALYLIGTGPMEDYTSFSETPWAQYQKQIKSIQTDSRSQYTTIGAYAFSDCENLESVELPNTVTDIKQRAFRRCKALTSVSLSSILKNIDQYAFAHCSSLAGLTIPGTVEAIGDFAFYACNELVTITIPAGVQTIGKDAFGSCAKLSGIQVYNANADYSAVDGVLYNKQKTVLCQCPAGKTGSFTVPGSVTEIADYAFDYCTGLTSITIPNSITSLGEYAFDYCTGLTSVAMGNGVTSIGALAFDYCTGLTSITIPNSVTSIELGAFSSCIRLTDLTIPASVTSIGEAAFSYCWGLTSIVVEKENMVYDSRDNCNAIIETATNTLIAGCKNTIIPGNITGIDGNAFHGCSGLTSITIPNSVTSIEGYAFYYCVGLESITCKAVNPPALGEDVFYHVNTTIPLYVPEESISAYQAAEQWKEFDVQADPTEAIEEVSDQHSAVSSQKVLRHGRLLIESGDRTYDALGAEVK